MHPYYTLFGQEFSSYTLMAGIAVAVTLLLVLIFAPKFNVTRDDSVYIYTFGLLGFGMGSKLLYLILNIGQILNNVNLYQGKERLQYLYESYVLGGFAIQGGILGFVLLTYIMSKRYKVRFEDFYALLIPALCLFCAMGRVGCYLEGCCYGKDIGGNIVPVQLISSFLNILLAIVILVLNKFFFLKSKLMPIYLGLYSLGRFVLDFFRGDLEVSRFFKITPSQTMCILILTISIIWIVLDNTSRRSYNL